MSEPDGEVAHALYYARRNNTTKPIHPAKYPLVNSARSHSRLDRHIPPRSPARQLAPSHTRQRQRTSTGKNALTAHVREPSDARDPQRTARPDASLPPPDLVSHICSSRSAAQRSGSGALSGLQRREGAYWRKRRSSGQHVTRPLEGEHSYWVMANRRQSESVSVGDMVGGELGRGERKGEREDELSLGVSCFPAEISIYGR